jgi:hypothetical protein
MSLVYPGRRYIDDRKLVSASRLRLTTISAYGTHLDIDQSGYDHAIHRPTECSGMLSIVADVEHEAVGHRESKGYVEGKRWHSTGGIYHRRYRSLFCEDSRRSKHMTPRFVPTLLSSTLYVTTIVETDISRTTVRGEEPSRRHTLHPPRIPTSHHALQYSSYP